MGQRQLYALIAGMAVSVVAAGSLFSQAPVPPQPGGPVGGGVAPAPQIPNRPERSLRQGGDRLREMSPEDRQRFQSNIERWRQLPPEERRELRERAGWREQRLKREADAAMQASGLKLEAEKRAQFEARYMQERKRIEQALRQELRDKRQRELVPVVERLKKEFSQPQTPVTPTATLAPAPPSPSK